MVHCRSLSAARMAQVAPTSRVIKFGVFEVDLQKEEVRKSGLKLRLRGQPFQVLSILLERPGEVVTREVFQQRLWTNNDTFVDFEHGLNAVVNRLREVLGDSTENPHFIETVPRRGYRWMVPLEDTEDRSIPAAPRSRHKWLPWAASVIVLIGLSGGVLRWVLSHPNAPGTALTSVPITARPGYESDPSFSPDGSSVAFVRFDEDVSKSHIYVKLIDTGGSPLQLTSGPTADSSPVWSPDGRFIAFRRDFSEEKAAVILIPALGGPEQKVIDTLPAHVPSPFLAWSPDANSLVISHKDSPKEPAALFVVAIDTREKRRLTFPPPEVTGDTNPAFSPDGRTLAFMRMTDLRPELYLLAISDALQPEGEAMHLSPGRLPALLGHLPSLGLSWTEDGREILFSSWGQGLWRIGASKSAGQASGPEPLAFGENACCPAVSRRGQRLAYSNGLFHFSIWRMPTPGGLSVRDVSSARSFNRVFISSTRNDLSPQFSPDGKRIAFASQRSGNWEIWICDADGSSPVQLTSFRGPNVTTPRWSPDGGRIAFDSDAAGQYDIWTVDSDGGKPVRMTTDPANDGNPSWSHDGRWIYFDSARTGEQQVWKMPAGGGDAIQATRDGGYAPLESPDGRFLYYTKSLGRTSLWRVPVDGSQATKVIDGLSIYTNLAIVDKGIYFVPLQDSSGGSSIQFLNLETNQIRRVASFKKPLASPDATGGLATSPDGRWILYSQVDQSGAELRLVENFR